ncbi:hypothetical protein EST38_g3535 [Candolleomyces aberdarensis]|uniref:CSN8/PSMD8/EIF3K domain-containing protein n=1 Tax=Candolleomyces aberdarensis TaxID=2316362 RepID=A0A4V1Q4J7_9AGAR|nr:hypothetical protein EST38_g3535 [Candolleomyces aberdarensis]
MVNAPPTPPPLSTTELQDAARASSSQNTTETQSNAPDVYQLRFPAILDAVSRSDYRAVARIAEEIDLTAVGDHQTSRLLIIAPLVLAYLIEDQIPPARYALARLPDIHASLPLSKLLAGLVNVTLNRVHPQVYATATSLVELVSQPDFFHQELALVLTKLATVFMDRFRLRTFELLSKAYSSLPLTLAESYLGVSGSLILEEAGKNGWTYDASSQILKPKARAKAEINFKGSSSLSTFDFVTDSVGRLEA